MQIIIPMTGLGSRFVTAGYKDYKPMIEILNKPVIAYLLSMFKPSDDIHILLRSDFYEDKLMVDYLLSLHPNIKVHASPMHKKGPVYTLAQHYSILSKKDPILVSYCDYYMHWDYSNFVTQCKINLYDGAIPCYTGFHPHLLHQDNVYAACKVDEKMQLIEIREKHSFMADKNKDYHSAGAYYFRNREILIDYFHQLLMYGPTLNGEYYVSLVYNRMVQNGLKVWVDDKISHFCQWGTPKDMEESINGLKKIINKDEIEDSESHLYWKNFLKIEQKKTL